MNRTEKTTIDDVAEFAGVSIKTVSRVVNQEPNVKQTTRTRVNKAIKQLNYKPNQFARSLASRHSYLIGLLYDDPSFYEIPSAGFLINIQQGVLKACKAANYDLLIHPCSYHDENVEKEIKALIEHSKLDGIILAPPLSNIPRIVNAIKKAKIPLVNIAPGSTTESDNGVSTNDREISTKMTKYLVSLGHSKIAFLKGHPDHKAVANRFLGYKDGLDQSDIKFSEQLVMQGDNSIKSGERCASKLLKRKNKPTAIFAGNDDMAVGCLRVAHQMGIDIPQQLSVAGFDDIALAQQIYPTLTTIHQPLDVMSELATKRLIGKLRAEDQPDTTSIAPATLVVRESTGPAPD